MKTKSLLATLLVTIILLSSCILGVAENESASVSFKINKTSIAEQRTSISRQGGSTEESFIVVVSIIDATTEEVIAKQDLLIEAKSAVFEIQIGLSIIGKIEYFSRPRDSLPQLVATYISAPHTVTEGDNNIVAGLVVAVAGEFTYSNTTYEISMELTTGGENEDGKYTWFEAVAKWEIDKKEANNGWYLPSEGELDAAYEQLYAGGKTLSDDKLTGYLWSSTEEGDEPSFARKQRFSNGTSEIDSKAESLAVRLIKVLP